MRFGLAGGFNTLVSYAIYLGLSSFLDYQWAYFIAYACGIGVSYVVNARFVFHTALSWRALFAYPLVYLVQYAMSALALAVLVRLLHVPKLFAPLFVVALTVPATYVLSKFVLMKTDRGRHDISG